MKLMLILLLLLFSFQQISAVCLEGQININSASKEELDKIVNIGPARADLIINSRPFKSVDELLNLTGIGEKYLTQIKEQNLACVVEEEKIEKSTEEGKEENFTQLINEQDNSEKNNEEEESGRLNEGDHTNFGRVAATKNYKERDENFSVENPVIKLNAKVIKSEENTKKVNKSKYATYGFVGFCILLVILFLAKARGNKNDFEK